MKRRASLGTIFLTVFLDLLGFGLVVPYLPGVARGYEASAFVATLLGAVYSLMQLVFVPFWGQMSDRTGRRPILVVSIAASVVGFVILGTASSLTMLFVARIWSGIATSNIAVAQAYIADVTEPKDRSKGMGLIGAGIGMGFVFGPVIGGMLAAFSPPSRPGALPALAGAGLAVVNLILAIFFLPESLPPERRGPSRRRLSPFDLERYRAAMRFPGTEIVLALNFVIVLSFAAMEQTFRLFTEDAFHMSAASTGYVLFFVGMVLVFAQLVLIRPLSRAASERTLIRAGISLQMVGFLALAFSPRAGTVVALYAAMGALALGSALIKPSLSAHVSRCCGVESQGTVLGVLQSAGAFARVCGPATGGLLYQAAGHEAPYVASAIGMAIAGVLALRMRAPVEAADVPSQEERPPA